jgi:hypothetical protein
LRRGRNRVTAVTFTHVHRCIDVPTCSFPLFIICVAQAYGIVVPTGRAMCTCARSTTALIAGVRIPHIWQTHSMEQQSVCEAKRLLTARVEGHVNPPGNPSHLAAATGAVAAVGKPTSRRWVMHLLCQGAHQGAGEGWVCVGVWVWVWGGGVQQLRLWTLSVHLLRLFRRRQLHAALWLL